MSAASPSLVVVIHAVGSRDEVEPLLFTGQQLQRRGHRVCIATHTFLGDTVLEHGMEFFDIDFDSENDVSFADSDAAVLPAIEFTDSNLRTQRRAMRSIMERCWLSCITPGRRSVQTETPTPPRVADLIIANPQSMAHVHCAERLGIPFILQSAYARLVHLDSAGLTAAQHATL